MIVERVEVYKDSIGEFRWTAYAWNNEIIGVSGEGYVNKSHACDMAEEMFPGVPVKFVYDNEGSGDDVAG